MKTVRILALHLGYGGVEKAIISMANLFASRYEVEIISVYDMPGAPAFPLDPRVKVRYLLKDIPNRAEWKAAVRAKKPLAVARESVKSLRIIAAKKSAVRRTIRKIRDGVLICTRHEDNLVLSRCGDPGVFKIAQLHHDHRFEKKYTEGIRKGYGNIDVLVMLTPQLAEEVREMLPQGSKLRVESIPNFLERYPEEPVLTGRDRRVVAVGRLAPEKGFDRLIRCFKSVHEQAPGWTLEIIGEGAEREKLEGLVRSLGLEECVSLPGRMESQRVEEEMLRAAVFAMSSYSEGFGFVIVEAQSCGLPTVAFDVRVGPGTILSDGEDGFLIPDGDEAAFSARLLELINAPELREKMGAAALRRSGNFSREKIGEQWFSLIGD